MQTLWEQFRALLGLGRDIADVNASQMAFRTIVIYVLTLAMVRIGSRRILTKATAFDVIVAIMLGSIMSRAINGSGPLFPTVLAGVVLIGMHSDRVRNLLPSTGQNRFPIRSPEDGRVPRPLHLYGTASVEVGQSCLAADK